MSKLSYPLENSNPDDEVRFRLYDHNGRADWGEVRVRREGNPDVLSIEAQQFGGPWKPLLKLSTHDNRLLYATFLKGANNG